MATERRSGGTSLREVERDRSRRRRLAPGLHKIIIKNGLRAARRVARRVRGAVGSGAGALLMIIWTSAVARLLLSDRQLMIMPTPPWPYASYVSSLYSAVTGSIAFLMLRSCARRRRAAQRAGAGATCRGLRARRGGCAGSGRGCADHDVARHVERVGLAHDGRERPVAVGRVAARLHRHHHLLADVARLCSRASRVGTPTSAHGGAGPGRRGAPSSRMRARSSPSSPCCSRTCGPSSRGARAI